MKQLLNEMHQVAFYQGQEQPPRSRLFQQLDHFMEQLCVSDSVCSKQKLNSYGKHTGTKIRYKLIYNVEF